ncbi:aminobenzoate oxygenase (plasmid) [Candidatus Megaera polyxenophila]|nr:aminobenzoate oxygenase [Candidatus Megaera polyxenophila]
MINIQQNDLIYSSKQRQWDKYASVRSKPRRFIIEDSEEYYFPVSRQPLCVHPLIVKLGDKAIRFILIQSVYKFMHEIAMLETEMVNSAACKLANNRLPYKFSEDICHDAITVIIDEAYHAFVAMDFMRQVEVKTKISPISMPNESPNTNAIKLVNKYLPSYLHDSFELIAVCISEHTLTKELINIGREGTELKSFSNVMVDHVQDEGRHASIFNQVLKIFWHNIDKKDKELIGSLLPMFIKEYLGTEQQIKFDQEILRTLGLDQEVIDTIISETHIQYEANNLQDANPIIKNVIKLLEETGVLNSENIRTSFSQARLL